MLALSAALLAAGAGAAITAGSSKTKTVRVNGPHFKVTLPAQAGQSQIALETVKVTVPKGVLVKSLRVKPRNVADLPASASIAAAVGPKSSNGRKVTFKVYVFMTRGYGSGARPTQVEDFVDVQVDVLEKLVHLVAHRSHPHTAFTAFDKGIQDCGLAWAAGFYGDGIWSGTAFASLQSSLNQPSPPESVIDTIVENACKGQAEGPQGQLPEAYDDGDG